jgi:succinate-acetate transporter protein
MDGTYIDTPETNLVSRVYSVSAVLYLQFVLHVMLFSMSNVLYFYISSLRSMCAVHSMAVFCGSLIQCLPGMVLR